MQFRAADSLPASSASMVGVDMAFAPATLAAQRPDLQAAVGVLMEALTQSVKHQALGGFEPGGWPSPFGSTWAAPATGPSTPRQAVPTQPAGLQLPLSGMDAPLPSPAATAPRVAPPLSPVAPRPAAPPSGSPRCPNPQAAARKNVDDVELRAWRAQTHNDLQCPESIQAEPGRSAADIINANPVFKHLGKQKDLQLGELKKRFGDWENDPDPKRRADAAERMSRLLTYVKSVPASDGSSRGDVHASPQIVGLTHGGKVREGTEASIIKNFAESGVLSLGLEPTNDRYVRKDGTTRSNAEVAFRDIGRGLAKTVSAVLGAVTDVAASLLGMVPGLGRIAAALLQGSAGAVANYADAGADIIGDDLSKAERQRKLEEAHRQTATNAVSAAVGVVDPTGIGTDLAVDIVDQAMQASAARRAVKAAQERTASPQA